MMRSLTAALIGLLTQPPVSNDLKKEEPAFTVAHVAPRWARKKERGRPGVETRGHAGV